MLQFNELQVRQFYRLLKHDGNWSQLHCQNVTTKSLISRELVNGEAAVISWAKKYNGQGNCFIGRNPRAASGAIATCTVLSLDIDPIREKDTAATEAQWRAAIEAGRKILLVCGYGLLASSGNGALLLFNLHEPISKELAESYGKTLEAKAKEILKGEPVNVDSTWDAPRLCKVLGTTSTKGDPQMWRPARFIDPPNKSGGNYDAFLQLVTAPVQIESGKFLLPDVQKGELDRSKADISLANRLKLQGFTAEDTFRSLCQHSFRPGREDDYKRIVQKVYSGDGSTMVAGRNGREVDGPVLLWTPVNGLSDYQRRGVVGEPELPTGFKALDQATFGLVRGHIFTVAARTNGGKTSFGISVAAHLCGLSKRVLFISTETQFAEVWDRYIAASTGISAFKIQHGLVSDPDKECIGAFIERFKEHQFFVYDGSRPNLPLLRKAIEQTSPDVVVMDYFQHVGGRETRELEEFVMALHDLAKEKQVAVLMCAMLHDGFPNPKTGKVPPPSMRDMKSCKVLNDESRVVALLDWDRDGMTGAGPAAVKVVLAKNKGPRIEIVLRLNRAIPRFEDEGQ